jgi:hypothetical protein
MRTRQGILYAALTLRSSAIHGRRYVKEKRTVTNSQAMDKVAAALEWAAGADNDFAEVLARIVALDRKAGGRI